jgi:hypothetical protein
MVVVEKKNAADGQQEFQKKVTNTNPVKNLLHTGVLHGRPGSKP